MRHSNVLESEHSNLVLHLGMNTLQREFFSGSVELLGLRPDYSFAKDRFPQSLICQKYCYVMLCYVKMLIHIAQ